ALLRPRPSPPAPAVSGADPGRPASARAHPRSAPLPAPRARPSSRAERSLPAVDIPLFGGRQRARLPPTIVIAVDAQGAPPPQSGLPFVKGRLESFPDPCRREEKE